MLIADDGRVVLSDFGPVGHRAGVGALAGAGIVLGSPNYVAPERLFDGVSTARADLWSLGATLYHAVEGRPPFRRATTAGHPAGAGRQDAGSAAGGPGRWPVSSTGLLRRDPAARLTAAEVEERLRGLVDRTGLAPGAVRPACHAPSPVAVVPAGRGAWRRPGPRSAAAAADGARPTRRAAGRPAGRWVGSPDGRSGDGPAHRGDPALAGPRSPRARIAPSRGGPGNRGGRSRRPAIAHRAERAAVPAGARSCCRSGFTWWNDPSGFRVAVPSGWRRTRDGQGALVLTGTAGEPSLRIGAWTPEPRNVVAGLIAEERDVRLTAYRRIRIEALPSRRTRCGSTHTGTPQAGPMRGLERVTTGGGQTYRIEWRAPRPAWADGLQTLDVVLDSFAPLPGA